MVKFYNKRETNLLILILILKIFFISSVQASDWVVSNNQNQIPPAAPITILEERVLNNGNPVIEISNNLESKISIKFSGPTTPDPFEVVNFGETKKIFLNPGDYKYTLQSSESTSTSPFKAERDYIYKIVYAPKDASQYSIPKPVDIITSTPSATSLENNTRASALPVSVEPSKSIDEKSSMYYLIIPLVILGLIGAIYSKKYLLKKETKIPVLSGSTPNQNIGSGERIKINGTKIFEILRGYSVLSNNDLKFGIRFANNTNFVITDVDVILDYSKNLFSMKDSEIQHLGNITPNSSRTVTYLLKPLGCIHNEQINALITYKDHTGKKQTLQMRPKEVHCVCPFLKEKPISEGEYSRLAANSEYVQEGISFKGISTEDLGKFMGETCRHMLYKVKEYDLEDKKVIYLSGEALGEKAYYLLTAIVQDYKGLTQVILRAHSDKKYGLNGFMNEMADSIRHLVGSVQNAKEVGIIENIQVINIIDSVVQRTSFNMGKGGSTQAIIKESIVQRSNIGKKD